MSGSTPKIAGTSAATGVALLPNTSGSHTLFLVALGAVVFGVAILAITGLVALKQRITKA